MKRKAAKRFYNKYIIQKPYIFYIWFLGFVLTIGILISQISIKEFVTYPCTYEDGTITIQADFQKKSFLGKPAYFYVNRNDAVYCISTEEYSIENGWLTIDYKVDGMDQKQKGFVELYDHKSTLMEHLLYL